METRKALGAWGEDLAATHMEALGWRIVDRNWRYSRLGELDIVALVPNSSRGTLVFCEVKTKSGHGYGEPLEAITVAKLRRIHRLACAWIAVHDLHFDLVRIDAIGVLAQQGKPPVITHAEAVRL